MLSYLEESYNREFKSVEYIPATRGFNDFMKENVLVAKDEKGIVVNVKEKVSKKGQFYDDYTNGFVSKLIENAVDFSGIENLYGAKTYVTLKADYDDVTILDEEGFSLSMEMINSWYNIISISDEANDEVLEQLFTVYEKCNSLGFGPSVFIVAFGGEENKSEIYVNNFLLYGVQDWEQYDERVKQVLKVMEEGLSFEQFKEQLVVVGG